MKLIFLGAGAAFTVDENNFHSNALLEDDPEHRLLIDCGSDVRWSLHALGYSHRDIQEVYITHLHGDHVGGLEWLGFTTKFDPQVKQKPKLHVSIDLAARLWNNVISGGLQSLSTEVATLSTYFDVNLIEENRRFKWRSIEFELIPTEHVFNGTHWVPSYGLYFKVKDKFYFYSADMRFQPEKYLKYYQNADLIFQECETIPNPSGVHCPFADLLTLDPSIKSKMWLYHYNGGEKPDAVAAGFRGYIQRGQSFEL